MREIVVLFGCFITYSFVGWVYESILCSITGRKLVNRGFLVGPICPIYGVGAIVVTSLFSGDESWLSIFLAAGVITCVVEYFSSWILEKLIAVRLWDYTEQPFNINGRVCLYGFLIFGVMSAIVVKYAHPALHFWIASQPDPYLYLVTGMALGIFLLDCVVSFSYALELKQRFAQWQQTLLERYEGSTLYEIVNQGTEFSDIGDGVQKEAKKFQARRFLGAFPKIKLSAPKIDILDDFKKLIQEVTQRTKDKK